MIKSVSKCSRPGGASLRIHEFNARETSFGQPLRVAYAFEDTSFWQELIDRHTPHDDEEARSAR